MSIRCLFGHQWNGCRCDRCGATRDEGHKFILLEGKCVERCNVCGKERNTEHKWDNVCKCKHCGTTRDKFHQYDSTDLCIICGKEKPLSSEEATMLVEEYKLFIIKKLEDFSIPINPAVLESIRYVIVVKSLMKISFSLKHTYEEFIDSIMKHNQMTEYMTLLSLGKYALYCVLAGFSTNEKLQENLNRDLSGEQYKLLMEDILKAWYNKYANDKRNNNYRFIFFS